MKVLSEKHSSRLLSLDILRGIDMFFIMGGGAFFIALADCFPCKTFDFLAYQMHHMPWEGLSIEDIIFPLFLFIAGISFPLSLFKLKKQCASNRYIYKKNIKRCAMLIFLGFIYNGLLDFNFETMRYASVLGRIGLAWMFATIIYMNVGFKIRNYIIAILWIGYWILLLLYDSPEGSGGPYSIDGSLVGYIDRLILPGRLSDVIHDAEGILSTVPAIGTALMGMQICDIITVDSNKISENKKVFILLILGILLISLGLLWGEFFPIIKSLWTSSFACLVSGISTCLFAVFYYIIDVKRYKKYGFFFKIIGMNSLTIYLAQRFVGFSDISERLFGGIISFFPEQFHLLLNSIAYIFLCWFFLYCLYRKDVFFKV